jgi:hypothetical protein
VGECGSVGDLKDARLMLLKACLFLLSGAMAAIGLLLEHFSPTNLFLLLVVIFSFSRAYYFCFYVIEHYIDSSYKFAGLSSVLVYWWHRRRANSDANRG